MNRNRSHLKWQETNQYRKEKNPWKPGIINGPGDGGFSIGACGIRH
jgi:hypothetical protein